MTGLVLMGARWDPCEFATAVAMAALVLLALRRTA